jgi:hypothetical protein
MLRLFGDLIWAWLGLAAFLAGLQFFLDPAYIGRTALGRNLTGYFDEGWNLAWTAGGLLLAWGVLRRVPRTELIGLLLLTAAMLVNTIAVAVDIGLSPSLVIIATATVACALRAVFVALTAPRKEPA